MSSDELNVSLTPPQVYHYFDETAAEDFFDEVDIAGGSGGRSMQDLIHQCVGRNGKLTLGQFLDSAHEVFKKETQAKRRRRPQSMVKGKHAHDEKDGKHKGKHHFWQGKKHAHEEHESHT